MTDYSNNSAAEIKTTVYGIDTAILVVVFASVVFWVSVGGAVWLFL
jgi:hypothetical protein